MILQRFYNYVLGALVFCLGGFGAYHYLRGRRLKSQLRKSEDHAYKVKRGGVRESVISRDADAKLELARKRYSEWKARSKSKG